MKRTIILLKAFSVFLILLQGCNIKHETKEEGKKKEEYNKIFAFSADLNDKYSVEKSCCLAPVERSSTSYLGVQPYRGSLIFVKELNEKYDSFINREICEYSLCALCDDILYVKIDNGDPVIHRSILLKIERNKCEIIGIESSDIELRVFTPIESTLKISSDEFHVGDTIVGEIFLTCSGSWKGYEDYTQVYKFDGHFMGVINQGTEEWKDMLYHHSGKHFFQDK